MANRFLYNNTPIIQCGFFTGGDSSAGIVDVIFPVPFNSSNISIVATCRQPTLGGSWLTGCYILNSSISATGFTAICSYAVATAGTTSGGYLNYLFNYVAVENVSSILSGGFSNIQQNIFNGSTTDSTPYPPIQVNYPNTIAGTTSFPIACAIGINTTGFLATPCIGIDPIPTTTSFSCIAFYKFRGSPYGGLYKSRMNYIALSNAFFNYSSGGYPIAQCGTFTFSGGAATVSFPTSFKNGTICVVAMPFGYTNYFMVSITILTASATGFSAVSYFKDGRDGENGGGVWNGGGIYVAIRYFSPLFTDPNLLFYLPFENTFSGKEFWNYNRYFVDDTTITNDNESIDGSLTINTSITAVGTGSLEYIASGTAQRINLKKTTPFFPNSFSFTLWSRVNAFSSDSARIFTIRIGAGFIVFQNAAGRYLFSTDNAIYKDYTSSVLSANTFYHWAVVVDGTTITYYLDSVAQSTQTITPGTTEQVPSEFYIGSITTTATSYQYVDDFRFYTRPLTLPEIREIYNYRGNL